LFKEQMTWKGKTLRKIAGAAPMPLRRAAPIESGIRPQCPYKEEPVHSMKKGRDITKDRKESGFRARIQAVEGKFGTSRAKATQINETVRQTALRGKRGKNITKNAQRGGACRMHAYRDPSGILQNQRLEQRAPKRRTGGGGSVKKSLERLSTTSQRGHKSRRSESQEGRMAKRGGNQAKTICQVRGVTIGKGRNQRYRKGVSRVDIVRQDLH